MQPKLSCTQPECNFCINLKPDEMVDYFLQESNAIESFFDPDALEQSRKAWAYLQQADRLTGGVIQEVHKIVTKGQKILPNERGFWRRRNIGMRQEENGGIGQIPWGNIPESIEQWLHIESKAHTAEFVNEWIRQNHIQFEIIHPFADGNGRVGRLLLNWRRLKCGLPLLIIHSGNKETGYYPWFTLNVPGDK